MTSKPSVDDEGRMIERLDAGEPAGSPEEAQARAPYEQLLTRLRDEDEDVEPPAGWEDRAVARWSVGRRRRWIAGASGTAAGIAVAAVLLLRCGATESRGLELAVVSESGQVRRGEMAVGDTLQLRASGEAVVALLVYRGARRIASCPGDQGCRREGGALALELLLEEAGDYQIAVLSGGDGSFSPREGGLEVDRLAARKAGAEVEVREVSVAP